MIRVMGRVCMSAEGATMDEAIAAYRAAHNGASPDEWEEVTSPDEPAGGNIVAWCEGCGKPICDDEKSFHGEDFDLCEACGTEP